MTDASRSTAAGIAYMCGGVLFLVGLDTTARIIMERYSLTQLVFVRSSALAPAMVSPSPVWRSRR